MIIDENPCLMASIEISTLAIWASVVGGRFAYLKMLV